MGSTVVGDPLASVSIMTSTTTASPVTATIVTETNNETVIDCGTFDFEEVAPYRFWCDGVLVSSVAFRTLDTVLNLDARARLPLWASCGGGSKASTGAHT